MRILVTCEHGGNKVPRSLHGLFKDQKALLQTHRGYDIGALSVAKALSRSLDCPLLYQDVSRLVIDCNRSLHHRHVFSPITAELGSEQKDKLVTQVYRSYRQDVEAQIASWIKSGANVVHLSIHSFTPSLQGQVRRAEIGLLYDPQRTFEIKVVGKLQQELQRREPAWRVRRNYPYRGTADGFTTHLRRCFPVHRYAGIEVEINQKFWASPPQSQPIAKHLGMVISRAFAMTKENRA